MSRRDYEVGRGRPPKLSQFRKGQSGNPGGIPGPRKAFRQQLRAHVEAAMAMTPHDLDYTWEPDTVLERMARQIANKASEGERHAVNLLLNLLEDEERKRAPRSTTGSGGGDDGETPDDWRLCT